MKPTGLIEPWRNQINLGALAQRIYSRHRGQKHRVKLRDLASGVLGVSAKHGSAPEVALRNAIAELRQMGMPIGALDGPEGGIFWIADEQERGAALQILYAQRTAVLKAIAQLEAAALDWRDPPGQTELMNVPPETKGGEAKGT